MAEIDNFLSGGNETANSQANVEVNAAQNESVVNHNQFFTSSNQTKKRNLLSVGFDNTSSGDSNLIEIHRLVEEGLKAENEKGKDATQMEFKSIFVSNQKEYGDIVNMFYSSIVIYTMEGNLIYGVPVVLPQSQRPAQTIQGIMDYVSTERTKAIAENNGDLSNVKQFLTYDATIDQNANDAWKEHLARACGTTTANIKLLPAVVFSELLGVKTKEEREILAGTIIIAAVNSLFVFVSTVLRKDMDDVTISQMMEFDKSTGRNNKVMEIGLVTHSPETSVKTLTGDFVRANWELTTTLKNINSRNGRNGPSWNTASESRAIIHSRGYIDAVTTIVPHVTPLGETVNNIRFSPHIIITDTGSYVPSLNMMLMSILNSSALLDKSIALHILKNNIGTENDPSNLDVLSEIGRDLKRRATQKDPGEGFKIDLSDKKLEEKVVDEVLSQMFSSNPILSLDIVPYASNATGSYTLETAANGGPNSATAVKDIITACDNLTDGHFVREFTQRLNKETFTSRDIFDVVTYFPLGYYYNKNEVYDLRNIDLSVIVKRCVGQHQPAIKRWMDTVTTTNKEVCILDQLDILNKNIGISEAIVSRRGTRVTFTAVFIDALYAAAVNAGLQSRLTAANISTHQETNFDYANAVYANALFGGQTFRNSYSANFGGRQDTFNGFQPMRNAGSFVY